jgi:chorismate mutase
VTSRDFEQLAGDAQLGKPLVRARVREVIERVMTAVAKVPIGGPVAEKVADLIRKRCETSAARFRSRS